MRPRRLTCRLTSFARRDPSRRLEDHRAEAYEARRRVRKRRSLDATRVGAQTVHEPDEIGGGDAPAATDAHRRELARGDQLVDARTTDTEQLGRAIHRH